MKYAQWGDVVFEVLSYRAHDEQVEFPYAHHQTIKPPSSLQWMGDRELKKIKLALRFHAHFCNPEELYKQLIEEARKGEAKKLIIAEKVVGDFVVERINSSIQQIDAWGKPVIIDVDVEFSEYIEKKPQTRQVAQTPKKSASKKAPAKAQSPKQAQAIITR